MNSEGDYTLCNLDTHSYANAFTNSPDLSNTIFATPPHPGYQGLSHAGAAHHRSLDTGQASAYHLHYSGSQQEGVLGNGTDLPLAAAPQSLGGYPLNTSAALARAATRHHAGASPYGHLPDLSLSSTSPDCYLNGNTVNGPIGGGHNGQGMCMDISPGVRPCYPCPSDPVRGGPPTPTGGYPTAGVPSPIKSEGCNGASGAQNLHNKPFRWMTIKRNAAKPGKCRQCHYSHCLYV